MFLLNFIIKNNGATVEPRKKLPVNFKKGFAVSYVGHEKTAKVSDKLACETIIKKTLQTAKISEKLAGFWIDNGTLYADLSKVLDDKAEALELGRQNHQLAIFNFSTFQSIPC